MKPCALCHPENENILWQDDRCRVILVEDPDYPGFCRVIWGAHVKEMTDLTKPERSHLMAVVFVTEEILRETMHPDKINLASLGNQVPHLHWHVIPRFADDAHFPDPIWVVRKHDTRTHTKTGAELARELAHRLDEQLD